MQQGNLLHEQLLLRNPSEAPLVLRRFETPPSPPRCAGCLSVTEHTAQRERRLRTLLLEYLSDGRGDRHRSGPLDPDLRGRVKYFLFIAPVRIVAARGESPITQ